MSGTSESDRIRLIYFPFGGVGCPLRACDLRRTGHNVSITVPLLMSSRYATLLSLRHVSFIGFSLYIAPTICHSVTPSNCHIVTPLYCHAAILSHCHTIPLSYGHVIILSLCYTVTLSWCYTATLLYCHAVMLSHRHTITPSYCHSLFWHASLKGMTGLLTNFVLTVSGRRDFPGDMLNTRRGGEEDLVPRWLDTGSQT